MFDIGIYVTRKSYNNDIVFEIIDKKDGIYILKGALVRLYADSSEEDLVIYNKKVEDSFYPNIQVFDNLDRNEYFYLPGRILHIDGDNDYLNKCMKYYKKHKIKAYGFYTPENEICNLLKSKLEKYNPDILVITGHDAYFRKKESLNNYKNTNYFVDAVKIAREYECSHDKLIIIAGACQSDYEELIRSGANFASSPKRINIHALDPAIVASSLAFSDKNKNIDLINILSKTKYGSDGMGGIITRGTMYTGYPRI